MALLRDKEKRNQLRRELYARVDKGLVGPAEAVRTLRRIAGLSRKEYALRIGISENTVKSFEQGRGNPTVETILKMLQGSGLELRVGRKELVD
jgi:transcriptional regulator with XRE-family HTH domain